jgi:hypothetical protein
MNTFKLFFWTIIAMVVFEMGIRINMIPSSLRIPVVIVVFVLLTIELVSKFIKSQRRK